MSNLLKDNTSGNAEIKHHCGRSGKCAYRNNRKSSVLTVFGAAIIAILPKCPLCALAYSSAITMCSGATLYEHNTNWTSYISLTLCMLTIGLVLWNYKGYRTILAVLTILAGSLFIMHTEFISGNVTNYYTGSVIVFFGVWLNGSFWHFARKWGGYISSAEGLKSEAHGTD